MKNKMASIALTAGLIGGGAAGLIIGATHIASAQTTTVPAPATPAASSGAVVDNSNKDAAHEAAETPEVAAAEAAGKGHGGNGPSNKDAAHEAAESPAHAAEEAARDAGVTPAAATTATAGVNA